MTITITVFERSPGSHIARNENKASLGLGETASSERCAALAS